LHILYMPQPLPIAARVPLTAKPPSRCPHCGSKRLIRKGTRRKKLEIVQLWQCKLCRRVFTPAPAELRYKTYPLRIVLDGATFYNLGYSLDQAAAKVKSHHGYKIAASTLASWMAEHRDLMAYTRLRNFARRRFRPGQTIATRKLYHRQVYSFAYHRPKLALVRESAEHRRFGPLADFLERVPEICPHDLFQGSSRASQFPNFVSLLPGDAPQRSLTGHIDFVQVRNGAVHILDYEPDARTNHPIAQLTLYALALTRLAGLRLFDIKCAWFNEEQYCEFFPRALLSGQL
jgi:transposase-like protein